jgi:hypothetical protein
MKIKPIVKGEWILNRNLLIGTNVITGLFVAVSSLIGYGISGIGEGSTNDFTILLWLFVWVIGLFLQFNLKIKIVGFTITLIPVAFFLYVYLAAYMM